MARLFIEDRRRHVRELILPALKHGVDVVCDRYKLSTIAYQAAQGLDMDKLIARHKGMPVPDITFFLYVTPEVAMRRTDKKDKKFERSREFQEKVLTSYFEAIGKLGKMGEKIVIIDGNQKPKKVAEYVWKKWKEFVAGRS